MADKVTSSEKIVVKPLSSKLKPVGLYIGVALLDDKCVTLILDIGAVARRSSTGASAQVTQRVRATAEAIQARASDVISRALAVSIGDGYRVAIPLVAVTRLKHVNAEKAEQVSGHGVIQYYGQALPIVRLDRLLGVISYGEPKDL